MESITAEELYAQLYDSFVSDWEGEVDFYRELICHSPVRDEGVLEIACGTGRIAMRLAKEGIPVTGLDLSDELLAMAKEKSAGMPHVHWVQGDMKEFELGQQYSWAIIPGHSFQFMLTADEQMQCLEQINKHLVPGGRLVIHLDHQDIAWLGGLVEKPAPEYGRFQVLTHPITGVQYRRSHYWVYAPATQTATVFLRWEQLDAGGEVVQTWEAEPKKLHCVFRLEMEHLLMRAGFCVDALYGDFFKTSLTDTSTQMIWLARKPG